MAKKSTFKKNAQAKPKLHPRNKNGGQYDFGQLIKSSPELAPFVQLNVHQKESIDFANPIAVRALNKALLKYHYGVEHWDIPQDYLVPPIPGRADYIHHIADLLCSSNYGKIPMGESIKVLDIGVGANCIYPIIGTQEYGWSFIGADIDPIAIESVNSIVAANPALQNKIEAKLQEDPNDFFYGVIQKDAFFDLSISNPPFHASEEEANAGTLRKLNNLNKERTTEPKLNFGGQQNELIYKGGEERFVGNMIRQSKKFGSSCYWFSTLVSKATHLNKFYAILKELGAVQVETIPMGQGNKTSRILAWTFLSKAEQNEWKNNRWNESQTQTSTK